MPIEKGLRRKQLERLKSLLSAESSLAGTYFGDILLYPVFEPTVDNNPDNLPTLALYCFIENDAFATTTEDRKPGAFTMLLLFAERENMTAQEHADLYNSLLDTTQLLLDFLIKKCKRDPAPLTTQFGLWHKLTFGGDKRGVSAGEFNPGESAVTYRRTPGKMQAAQITFFLSANVAR